MTNDIPLEEELITGYRDSKISIRNGKFVLKGRYGQYWDSARMTAECKISDRSAPRFGGVYSAQNAEEHLKAGTCTCGIYFYREEGFKRNDLFLPETRRINSTCTTTRLSLSRGARAENWLSALVRVTAWGYVREGSIGWKGQHVKVEEIFILPVSHRCHTCGKMQFPHSLYSTNEHITMVCPVEDREIESAQTISNIVLTQLERTFAGAKVTQVVPLCCEEFIATRITENSVERFWSP